MSKKEKLLPNVAPATLYVGVGGIGSKVIREVLDLAKNDNLDKARFVIFDTDVNDLEKSDDGVSITAVQTSSPRTIRDYLMQDEDAREEWFPNNMIINGKTVSEGAGQVRAISRLALNATIKTGRIKALYSAIDELFNKDGADKKQTLKVIVASTVAGGTGSGIAMIVAMLIRNYLADNYPDSSAIIRGFLLMPGVMDTIKPSTSEKLSLQRNGYATIKEINAFMMRPFFEAVPELRRYLDLSVDVPNIEGGVDSLKCTPFDFCFLFDRTDDNVCNMPSLAQYRSYVAHSIYEQCIGPMSGKASSKEDNIHREFLDEKKLSRNRFGGAGAATIRYPHDEICSYIAYDWIEKKIIGHSGDMDESKREALIADSWLVYDSDYQKKMAQFTSGSGNATEEPKRDDIYVADLENGDEKFSRMLREKFIDPKNKKHEDLMLAKKGNDASADGDGKKKAKKSSGAQNDEDNTIPAVKYTVEQMIAQCMKLCESSPQDKESRKLFDSFSKMAASDNFPKRFRAINDAARFVDPDKIRKTAASFIDRLFNSSNKMDKTAAPYSIEYFLTLDGEALHPNAMRYMLYKLEDYMQKLSEKEPVSIDDFRNGRVDHLEGKMGKNNTRVIEQFQVKTLSTIGKETTLEEMCDALDEVDSGADTEKQRCNSLLTAYAAYISTNYHKIVCYHVCNIAKQYLSTLIGEFENFYDKFETKVTGLDKRKKTLVSSIKFNNGDCVYNLFNNPTHLNKLLEQQTTPESGTKQESDLFAGIYDAIKSNAKKAEMKSGASEFDSVKEDVFEDVVVAQYKDIVSEWCKDKLDVNILGACALEHRIKCMCEADRDEKNKEELIARANSDKEKNAYLKKMIAKGFNLASPSIIRKEFEESRAVDAMAFNKFLEPTEGILMPSGLFSADFASESVSKYELRFFRSVYNITPVQLQKLCAPQVDPGKVNGTIEFGDETEPGMVGAYFTAYQNYMAKIGPDNRLNPVITPHIDKRWNSITVLPELDPQGYQRILMKRIHKAMIYGFIYKIIEKRQLSMYDADKLIYEYTDGRNGTKTFTVSNHTKCDRLFEVLDSLYFDRYAVHSIHDTVDAKRKKEFQSSTPYADTTFAKFLDKIDRMDLMDSKELKALAAKELVEKTEGEVKELPVSLFEMPMFYWASLPKKDSSELEIMVDAIFEIIEKEISTFENTDDINARIAEIICEHYNKLYKYYELCQKVYTGHDKTIPTKENVVFKIIRKKVLEKLDDLDVSKSAFVLVDKTDKDDLF